MASTYPYAAKGAPTVGSGLGGLPRRLDPVISTPVVDLTPAAPYRLSKSGQLAYGNGQQTANYSPAVIASSTYSDGTYSDLIYYLIRAKTFSYMEKSYSASTRMLKTTGGNATFWQISQSGPYALTKTYCLKNDLSGMVALNCSGETLFLLNSACYEIVNGVETHYFITYNTGGSATLSKVVPDYTSQTPNQSAAVATSWVYSSATYARAPAAIFLKDTYVYVLSYATGAIAKMFLDVYNKSDLNFVTSYSYTTSTIVTVPSSQCFAENATTIAIRYADPASGNAGVFILDKTTLKGCDYYGGIGGDSSWQCRLLSDSTNIYMVTGYGSGGSYGSTSVYILQPGKMIQVGSQTYSGATFSLAQSISCTVPNGYVWPNYYAPGGGSVDGNSVMVFVPNSSKTFSFSCAGYNFSQSWSESALTQSDPAGGGGSIPPNGGLPYTPTFTAFNALGTNFQ